MKPSTRFAHGDRSSARSVTVCLALSLAAVGCGASQPATADVVVVDRADAPAADAPATDAPATDAPATDAPAADAANDLVEAADADAAAADAPALDGSNDLGPAPMDAPMSDLGGDLGATDAPRLLPVGGRCAGDAACASGMCEARDLPGVCGLVVYGGWTRVEGGPRPCPAAWVAAGVAVDSLRGDGYCWARNSRLNSSAPIGATAPWVCYPGMPICTMVSDAPQHDIACVPGATGICAAPCRSVDDCPAGSNWTCAARAGAPNRCTCTQSNGVEVQCNGVDDDCDGVTDDASIRCGSACVDRSTDPANCGGCGVACRASEVCVAGSCQCPGLMGTFCTRAGACRDLGRDVANCGGCGVTCTGAFANAAVACRAGACGFTCNAGFGDCDGNAANGCETSLTNNAANCGACGTACSAGASCTAGRCACPTGTTVCGGACVNLGGDPRNCGTCGNRCAAGQDCARGVCVAAGAGVCPTSCVTSDDCSACWAAGEVRTGAYNCYSGLCLYSASGDGGVDVPLSNGDSGRPVCNSGCTSDLECRMCGTRCVVPDASAAIRDAGVDVPMGVRACE